MLRADSAKDAEKQRLAAQNALIKLGYSLKADGSPGAATAAALRDFERVHSLPAVERPHAAPHQATDGGRQRRPEDRPLRLRSDIWVAAYLRRVALEGAYAMLRRRGAAEAGAIFVKIDRLDGRAALFEPAPQSECRRSRRRAAVGPRAQGGMGRRRFRRTRMAREIALRSRPLADRGRGSRRPLLARPRGAVNRRWARCDKARFRVVSAFAIRGRRQSLAPRLRLVLCSAQGTNIQGADHENQKRERSK